MENIINRWKTVAGKNADSVAIIDRDNKYTYFEIEQKIAKYINLMKKMKVASHTPIGIYMNSSVDYWAAVMAVLFCDCYFVPIDISLPAERINQMISIADIKYILVNNSNVKESLSNCALINIHETVSGNEQSFETVNGNCKIAYVLFTSGTSGSPKGVVISRLALNNLISWFGEKYNIDNNTRLLQLASLSFDVSIEEFFGILMNGGIVVISDERCRYNSKWFSAYIVKHNITMVQMIPRMAKLLLCETTKYPTLTTVILGAEQLTEDVKNKIIAKGYRLFNHYGPTECTVDALTTECRIDDEVSIGRPIANMDCYIIDEEERKIDEPLQVGELIVKGVGVAEGYLNNAEETQRQFIFESDGISRAYRTGDLVMKNLQGNYVFIGRKDNQVKIHGKRIEIEEISSVAMTMDGIDECLIHVIEENNNKILILFWIGIATKDDILEYLKLKLPDYMIPNAMINIDELPINSNDKIDFEKLKEIYKCSKIISKRELTSSMENILKNISDTMKIPRDELLPQLDIDIEQMGIDSILFVQILVNLELEYDIELDDDFLLANEFSSMYEFIENVVEFLNKQEVLV